MTPMTQRREALKPDSDGPDAGLTNAQIAMEIAALDGRGLNGTIEAALWRAENRGIRSVSQEPIPGWQTIETAPRDGTRILAYDPKLSATSTYEAIVVEWRNGWAAENNNGWGCDEIISWVEPTHWQSLPPIPCSPQNAENEQQTDFPITDERQTTTGAER